MLDKWEDLVGSGVMKKVVVDGEGPFPDLGSLVLFNWKGTVLLKDGTAGFTFAERAGVEARIGDADEIPGQLFTCYCGSNIESPLSSSASLLFERSTIGWSIYDSGFGI